jgi:hypothetical protein
MKTVFPSKARYGFSPALKQDDGKMKRNMNAARTGARSARLYARFCTPVRFAKPVRAERDSAAAATACP